MFASSKASVRITKRPTKHVVKTVVQEHYLRDDIGCGSSLCSFCLQDNAPLSNKKPVTYLILDTNVILHQIDLLLKPILKNIIILATVRSEVQNRSYQSYVKLQKILADEDRRCYVFVNEHSRATYVEKLPSESPNDRNDRAIRVAAKWYQEHLKDTGAEIVLLTNDRDNKKKAIEMGINAQQVHEYIRSIDEPELIDSLAYAELEESETMRDSETPIYPEYLSDDVVAAGIKSGKFHSGPLRQNVDNWLEATVQASETFGQDILIKGRINMNRSIDGDIVVVELLPKSEWESSSTVFVDVDAPDVDALDNMSFSNTQKEKSMTEGVSDEAINPTRPTGRVVGVVRKAWRPYSGTIEVPATGSAKGGLYFFVPLNRRVPKIKIQSRQPDRFRNKRVVVCVDGWGTNSKYPYGHYVRVIGDVGDKSAESEALLVQHDIRIAPFDANVLADLPSPNVPIVPEPNRVDLRDTCIFSIDPPGCTDIDDALHVKKLPNGNYEVGVHIADVSHYVKEGTHMDKEARQRGNTVYLVEKRIDMLPELLGTNLCSLNQLVDRYAFSCIWELAPDTSILSTKFHKSLIRSRKAFSYGEAQARMDDENLKDEMTECIRMLNFLAKQLKKKRVDAGALTLASTDVRFIKDEENQDPVDVEMYETKETNSLVEEFMLLANISVAKQITKYFPAFAMLRRHPDPRLEMFEQLKVTMKRFGVELDTTSSKTLSDSLDMATAPSKSKDDNFNKLLRIMVTRCMNQARYFSSGSVSPALFRHYGLAVDIYTHFTSPIRRYADVIVHRLLAASIGHSALTQQLNAKDVQKTAEIINRRHRLADHAGRDSARLYTYIFFRGKTMSEPAYIMNIAENGFSILVPRYGIEGKVYISQPGVKNGWRFDLKNRSITSPDGLRTLNVLDRVMVDMHIDESKPHEPKLVFKCTDPNISMVSASASAPSTPTQQKNKASATESEEKNVKKRKSQEGGQSQLKPPTPKTAKNK